MKKIKNLFYVVCLMIVALCFQVINTNISENIVNASSSSVPFKTITLSNSNFNNNANSSTLEKTPTGWTKIKTSSTATSGIINVNVSSSKFASQCTNYKLETTQNPETAYTDFDDKVLMINSNSTSSVSKQESQGYSSATISLSKNSYYVISVWAYTLNATASIYLDGFEDYEDQITSALANTAIENIRTNSIWVEYTFYISTNYNSVSTNLELYLGATSSNTSSGVAFFDNVTVLQVSPELFQTNMNSDYNYSYIQMNNTTTNTYNFEDASLSSWEILGTPSEGNICQLVNVSSSTEMTRLGLTYLGTDLTYNNKYALVLSSEDENYIGYSSPAIDIDQYGLYKITVNVKCDNITGNVNINLVEQNDVNEFYEDDLEDYEPTTETISLSSNTTNNLSNDYKKVTFYVSGHTLYDTSVKIELCLGSESESASGTVAFDNLTVEQLPYDIFNDITAGTNESKVELTTISGTPSITNGYFNDAHTSGLLIDNASPLVAEGWEQTSSENEYDNIFGIVNTNNDKWTTFGLTISNPKNPILEGLTFPADTSDTNNILMIYNKTSSYQTITGPSFTVDSDSYYTLTFNYKAINSLVDGKSIFNIYLVDENDNVVFEDLNVYSSTWPLYKATIKTQYASSTLKLVFEVGTETEKAKGVVYIDNVSLNKETYDETQFTTLVNNNEKILDLSNMGLNLKGDTLDANGMYNALMFTSALEEGTQYTNCDSIATGGIITEDNIYNVTFPSTHTSSIKNMIAISNFGVVTYALTSQQTLSLTKGSYYKFSIYVKTDLSGLETDEDFINYGATFALSGLEDAKITNIKSTDFNQYIIYVYAEEDATVQPKFSLTSTTLNTTGNAFFDTFSYETIDKATYTSAVESDNILLFANTAIPDDTTDDDTTTDTQSVNVWIAASTIIMVVAMIIAIVGFSLRKVEIKKFKVAKQAVYNRETTLVRDIVIKEAEKRRDEELKNLKEEYKTMEGYLAELETQNRERLNNQRREHGKEITRKAEKEFKMYANARQSIIKNMAKIQDKIKDTNSPEYLIRQEKIIQNEKPTKKA